MTTTNTPEQPSPNKEASLSEAERKQQEAQEQLDHLMAQSRPKNLGRGLTSGVGNIVGGAVGGVGLAVLAPTVGLSQGFQSGGVLGGVTGLVGGAVVGVVGGAAVAVGGALSGVMQIGRGIKAVPKSITEPKKGKWWDENEGEWVETNLVVEEEKLKSIPEDDNDILGDARDDAAKPEEGTADQTGTEVKEMFYYDALEVQPTADASRIKRQYYVLARKYHPDKVGADDLEAAEKFKVIAEAYQVLSDQELRATYDKEGRDGLSPDKTSVAEGVPKLDPTVLFAFLFGSDKFNAYVGTLAMATSASVADSPKISYKDGRIIQKRRCTRLAISLVERLKNWQNEEYDLAKTIWKSEAEELVKASYGIEMIHLIGSIYALSGEKFIGSLSSGVGMPSISNWAHAQHAAMKRKQGKTKGKVDTMKAGMDMMTTQAKIQAAMEKATTDEERAEIQKQIEAEMSVALLNVVWSTTAVDITTTLYETCQMVLFDLSVSKETRLKRGHGLKALGDIFIAQEAPAGEEGEKDARTLYQEAAFAAMLDTVKRQEEGSFRASIQK